MADKRLHSFRQTLMQYCRKRSTFRNHIDINVCHVAKRSQEAIEPARVAITPELVAAMILHGAMNRSRCIVTGKLEIALEGKYAEVRYPKQMSGNGWVEVIERDLCVRVIVRETRPKHLVVTVYPDRCGDIDPNTVPRVPHEIWD